MKQCAMRFRLERDSLGYVHTIYEIRGVTTHRYAHSPVHFLSKHSVGTGGTPDPTTGPRRMKKVGTNLGLRIHL